ncbi:hypothetical protein SAMN02745687_02120 [Lachnospiraceae bacterium NK3A20]|nr:hypothetical protein SAMN02745687_02120 [Lachnospiraceae bacterium NK3A20]
MCRVYNAQKIGRSDGIDRIPPGARATIPTPKNCPHPCCYGKGKSYCFPCMKKLIYGGNRNG